VLDLRSVPSIPSSGGFWSTPAAVAGWGLDFPAHIVAAYILVPFGDSLPGPLPPLSVFLLVTGLWYLIGNWFDHRA